ncbi:unnamed protein product [Arctia plantaginis]|uniref:Trissin n=1 Tax=Arctia plantaginis TaxID=874455 RepID=A0A8S1B9K6_ARCPL|nr:unnamed protein product [Arctia plantaginis]CAB3259406.1 unnamed protein product [Arctia plantaginis]
MLKILAVVSLMFIVNTLWASSLSCNACGRECASACGTRRFRSCCFNYLRKKRGPEAVKFYSPVQQLEEIRSMSKFPLLIEENIPVSEEWLTNMLSNNSHRYIPEDLSENHYYDS